MDPYAGVEAAVKERMRDLIAYMSEAHYQEVKQLREKVRDLSSVVERVQGVALCARIDEPDMETVSREVAVELAFSAKPLQDSPRAQQLARQSVAPLPAASPRSAGTAKASPRNADGQVAESPRKQECNKHGGYMDAAFCQVPNRFMKRESTKLSLQDAGQRDSLHSMAADEATKQRKAEEIRRDADARSVVEHPFFDPICAVMIVLNSVIVMVDVEWKTTHEHAEPWVDYLSAVCSVFFLSELLARVWVYRLRFFYGGESYLWNWFDTLLVGVSMLELSVDFFSTDGMQTTNNIGSGLKAVKMLRIARVFRVFRFFKELSLLVLMILDSMKSLMWALVMLSIIIFVFAVLFTQMATDHIKEHSSSPTISEVQRQFGSIPLTVYSLLQAMLGGVSWGVASDALWTINPGVFFLFFVYIFFTMLAFLNITTGVFVDNAVETARTQRDFLVKKEAELKDRYMSDLRDLFREMDEDESGTVCLEEVKRYFEDPRVQSYFAALGLDSNDAERLFSLLDIDGDGDVSVDEFLDGCLRLKGQARSIDVQHLLMEFKKFNKRFNARSPAEADFLGLAPMYSHGHRTSRP